MPSHSESTCSFRPVLSGKHLLLDRNFKHQFNRATCRAQATAEPSAAGHQLSCEKAQPGKAFQMFTQLLFGGFLKSFLPNPHGWGTDEISECSFSLTVCSIFGFWSHSVDFADERKLQNFVGMSQHGLESGCEQHLRIRLSPIFPT